MKKGMTVITLCIAMGFLLSGCQSIISKEFKQAFEEEISKRERAQAVIKESWASYSIPVGWAEEVESAYDGIRYFLRNDVYLPEYYSYISVECIETDYSIKEYKDFAKGLADALYEEYEEYDVDVTGFTTDNGYLVLVAEIGATQEENYLEKQYYIIGDKMCAILYSCDYFNENITDVDETANEMINSFEWTEMNDELL